MVRSSIAIGYVVYHAIVCYMIAYDSMVGSIHKIWTVRELQYVARLYTYI